jgi:hypothetical protein
LGSELGVGVRLVAGGLLHVLHVHVLVSLGLSKRFYSSGFRSSSCT